ncbi:MAG: hypothetical protein IPM58_17835 [Nitrospira sp.]|nr:hypothetical protein [Nitrospira sp.]
MNRHLDFFEPGTGGAMRKPLERAFELGARKAMVIGPKPCGHELADIFHESGISWSEGQLATFQRLDIADADLVLVTGGNGGDVSRVLHACIDGNIAAIAPITDHHCSKRTVFLLSIPKAGTHMVIRLLDLMGVSRSPERAPQPGTWSTPVGYHYHAPCREFMRDDWFDPMGRQLLFRSPAIFVYRNPLDIVVSERDWFVKPEHAFSGYLNCCADSSQQLDRLIADSTVMGTIRDRINRYAGWLNFSNVIPVSYEDLVGERGGGSDTEQLDTIWAMQLKLHIGGSPQEYGSRLYDPASATFSKGRIGRHMECLEERHLTLLNSLPQDFMQSLGYAYGSRISSKAKELRRRPLVVKELSPNVLYTPRLVREGLLGWNIAEIAGKYFPVRQGVNVMSAEEAKLFSSGQEGFMSLRDAVDAVIHSDAAATLAEARPEVPGTELVVEGYCGFNVVRHNGSFYGFDQALGSIDIRTLIEPAIEDLKRRGSCVSGVSISDVKMEILRLAMGRLGKRGKDLKKHTNNPGRAFGGVLEKMGFAGLVNQQKNRS